MKRSIKQSRLSKPSFRLSNRRFCSGLAIVETAIVLPLLLTITFASIEYGWMLLAEQQITNVSESAARAAATPNATNAAVTSSVSSLMSAYNLGSSGYSITFTPSNCATVATGSNVTVAISIPYRNIEITGVSLFPMPTTIASSSTVVKEGN